MILWLLLKANQIYLCFLHRHFYFLKYNNAKVNVKVQQEFNVFKFFSEQTNKRQGTSGCCSREPKPRSSGREVPDRAGLLAHHHILGGYMCYS